MGSFIDEPRLIAAAIAGMSVILTVATTLLSLIGFVMTMLIGLFVT